LGGFDAALKVFVHEWQEWQRTLFPIEVVQPREKDFYRISMMVINAHEAKSLPGGIIASLSIPWGFSRWGKDLGGYHLVWPRDMVEIAGARLAGGGAEDARRVLHYLWTTQESDGRWAQNMWLNGQPYWDAVQREYPG
jgi:glucoamylase